MFQSCSSDTYFFNERVVWPINLFMNKHPLDPYGIAHTTESGAMNFQKRLQTDWHTGRLKARGRLNCDRHSRFSGHPGAQTPGPAAIRGCLPSSGSWEVLPHLPVVPFVKEAVGTVSICPPKWFRNHLDARMTFESPAASVIRGRCTRVA